MRLKFSISSRLKSLVQGHKESLKCFILNTLFAKTKHLRCLVRDLVLFGWLEILGFKFLVTHNCHHIACSKIKSHSSSSSFQGKNWMNLLSLCKTLQTHNRVKLKKAGELFCLRFWLNKFDLGKICKPQIVLKSAHCNKFDNLKEPVRNYKYQCG